MKIPDASKYSTRGNELKEEIYMFEKLFTPIKIRGMELKHRIIMPAMGTKFSGNTSFVTPTLIHYHAARAKGGEAL